MTDKKYELVRVKSDDFGATEFLRRELFRIRALKDFYYIKKGDLGGFVNSEENLSQEGDSWIYKDAVVSGNARVEGNALVGGYSRVSGNAKVEGNAQVYDIVGISDLAIISDHAYIYGTASVRNNARVCGHFKVGGNARVRGNAILRKNGIISSGRLDVEADGFTTTQDSRGYTFLVAWKNNEIVSVTAGCSVWNSMQEARNHFLIDYNSDGDVDECLAILNHLETIFHLKTR